MNHALHVLTDEQLSRGRATVEPYHTIRADPFCILGNGLAATEVAATPGKSLGGCGLSRGQPISQEPEFMN